MIPEDLLKPFLGSLAFGIDIAVGVVIAISVIRGFIMYVKLLRRSPLEQRKEEEGIKQYVGNGLILALDLAVGSDIIQTNYTSPVRIRSDIACCYCSNEDNT